MFEPEIANGKKGKSTQKVCVVEKLRKSLLGKPAITALSILKRTNEITSDLPPSTSPLDYKEKIKAKFPKLFTGLGTINSAEYSIKLQPHA